MSFLDDIFEKLKEAADRPVLQEIRDGRCSGATGTELLASIQTARDFLARAGLKKGDRCALLAPNSIRWATLDLAIMAEGAMAVPLYARQAPTELVAMMKDCSPTLVCCADEALRDAVHKNWPEAPGIALFDDIFSPAGQPIESAAPLPLANDDPVTIIYTSGTSGEPKGVILSAGSVTHILYCTNARLDLLMGARTEPDRVFHYPPFCFAASWILLLTCLSRRSVLSLSTDLTKLGEELKLATPNYFLNVPTLLERVRAKIEEQLRLRSGMAALLFEKERKAWLRVKSERARPMDPIWLALANALMFPKIRKSLGPNLKALICGSAPLNVETQHFFMMLGVPVLQVYGLTETTAICTMDDPRHVEPGRVGTAIPGMEMKLGDNHEILVRGPNVFHGYWNRPAESAKVLFDGWFHTGDQGEVDLSGNWRIVGRLKDLIILNSGHNIAPEPLEDHLLSLLPDAQRVMLVGNNRSYLVAMVSGTTPSEQVSVAIEEMNAELPHYKRIRGFHVAEGLFTLENGLLTTNGKLKRTAILAEYGVLLEELYRKTQA